MAISAGVLAQPRRRGTVLGVVRRKQTWLNLLYLLSPLPTGIAYLLVVAVLIGVQASIIGLVVFGGSAWLWRALNASGEIMQHRGSPWELVGRRQTGCPGAGAPRWGPAPAPSRRHPPATPRASGVDGGG
jgi:hypothetical protein